LWRAWKPDNKPWIGEEIPCNDTDQLLFAAATTIIIGDGTWEENTVLGLRMDARPQAKGCGTIIV